MDIVINAYLAGAAVAFVAGLFVTERVEGRVCTGEPDITEALMIAAIWPVFATLLVVLLVLRAKEGETP